MKKLIFLILVSLLITSCGSDNPQNIKEQDNLEIIVPETTEVGSVDITIPEAETIEVRNMMNSNKGTGMMTLLNMEEVKKHNSRESCYSVVDDKVYDLTSWIDQHPGGASNILKICGIDGTSAFRGKHDNNPKQVNQLKEFLIGNLVK